MALLNKRFTDREKAAIWFHVFGGCEDWATLYKLANDEETKQKGNALNQVVSKWKHSEKIRLYLEEVRQKKWELIQRAKEDGANQREQELTKHAREEERTRAESERTNEKQTKPIAKAVDYSDPANQAKKLNELVNSASDPGEALDALKVIISSQKADREAAKERKTVQVYMPLTCDSCPLVQKKMKK